MVVQHEYSKQFQILHVVAMLSNERVLTGNFMLLMMMMYRKPLYLRADNEQLNRPPPGL
jgi:hypothetical protein